MISQQGINNIIDGAFGASVEQMVIVALGDRGYPLKIWLLTLFTNPQMAQEQQYEDLLAWHSQLLREP